jgi:hypothetical protein
MLVTGAHCLAAKIEYLYGRKVFERSCVLDGLCLIFVVLADRPLTRLCLNCCASVELRLLIAVFAEPFTISC